MAFAKSPVTERELMWEIILTLQGYCKNYKHNTTSLTVYIPPRVDILIAAVITHYLHFVMSSFSDGVTDL